MGCVVSANSNPKHEVLYVLCVIMLLVFSVYVLFCHGILRLVYCLFVNNKILQTVLFNALKEIGKGLETTNVLLKKQVISRRKT